MSLKRPPWNEIFIENEKRGIVEGGIIIRDMDQGLERDLDVKCCSVCKRPIEEHANEQLMECLSIQSMEVGVF